MSLFFKTIIFTLTFTIATTSLGSDATLNFFFDKKLNPQIGLSCNSENECQTKCFGSESCQKPVNTCLSCIGAKSPYLNDLFNNVGDLTTTCFDHGILSSQAENLFKSVSMVPIFPISPYNPLGLKDFALMIKFMTLCPAGTREPVAIAITDAITHAIIEIPMVKCGQSIFPIVRLGEDCSEKTDNIMSYIQEKQVKQKESEVTYQDTLSLGESLPIKYDVLQYSEYAEAQYIACNQTSAPFCQKLCNSSLSCAIPLTNEITAKGITSFNQGQFKSCTLERFSPEILLTYLNSKDSFAFNGLSLNQTYELPSSTAGNFTDLSVIDSILTQFSGIFSTIEKSDDSSFFISNAYQMRLEAKMKSFCDPNSTPYILGHNDHVERVFCHSDGNSYFKIVAKNNVSCEEQINHLMRPLVGTSHEK